MTRSFEYQARVVIDAEIEVVDIFNCALIANNDLGQTWALVVKTDLGSTEIFEFGPVIPDLDQLLVSVNCSYRRFDCNDSKISKAIDKFLNDSYRMITQAQEVSIDEAKELFRNIGDYI